MAGLAFEENSWVAPDDHQSTIHRHLGIQLNVSTPNLPQFQIQCEKELSNTVFKSKRFVLRRLLSGADMPEAQLNP